MPLEMSRRTFLLGTAGLAVFAACGDDAEPDVSVDRPTTTTGGAATRLSLVLGSASVVSGFEERVAFAVLEGSPPRPVKGGPEVTVSFSKVGGDAGEPMKARYHSEGIEERPYWEVRRTFAEPGNYVMKVDYDGRPAEAGLEINSPDAVKSPLNGEALPAVASPTAADPKGVNPLCTAKPPCPLHDKSIDTALAEKKPLILLFSTPALCQSAICGPVLDLLVEARPAWEGKANAIHVEVFTDLTGQKATDTFLAFNLQIEPIFYFVGADGKVRERFDGPVDKTELDEAIRRLLA